MTRRKVLSATFMVGLLILGACFFLFFYGNPISRAESKEVAIEYLQRRYPQVHFTIHSISYYPGEGTFIINFASDDGTLQGNIDVSKGKVTQESLESRE